MGILHWTHNWTRGGTQFYSEIRNENTGHIWLCQTPMTEVQFQQLSLPEGFSKAAIGRAVHDLAYFRRSPDAIADSPLTTMRVGDWTYTHVARPGTIKSGNQTIYAIRLESDSTSTNRVRR